MIMMHTQREGEREVMSMVCMHTCMTSDRGCIHYTTYLQQITYLSSMMYSSSLVEGSMTCS